MTGGNSRPATTPVAEASQRLKDAGFEQMPGAARTRPHTQIWRNKFGKNATLDFTDDSFEECWTLSLETALAAADVGPEQPWATWWQAILGDLYSGK